MSEQFKRELIWGIVLVVAILALTFLIWNAQEYYKTIDATYIKQGYTYVGNGRWIWSYERSVTP